MKIHFHLPGAVGSAIGLHLPRWRPATAARRAAHSNRAIEPKGYSFDDSRHPVWAIANGIVVFFLVTIAAGSLLLIADAFLTRT
jgi:hypothetical protein